MRMCERQKITIGDVSGVQKPLRVRVLKVQQGNIVGPESVSGQLSERSQQVGDNRRRAGGIWISRMADNTQNSIFRQWAGRPSSVSPGFKPGVRTVMLHVNGVDQGDQDVHIQQKPGHGNSSRSLCTNSDVTRWAPRRTLSSGTPFRVLAFVSAGDNARLANEEITSPTDFFSIAASSFAALRTSSSIASVVRIRCHHASYIRCKAVGQSGPREPDSLPRVCR